MLVHSLLAGNAVAITIMLVLMPVVAALMKFVWVKESPTPYHLAGFIFAFIAVAFVAIGNSKKSIEVKTANAVTPVASVR